MVKNIDFMIERAVDIGVKANDKITFTDVKNASKFFHDLIESEVMTRLQKKINPEKSEILANYLREIAILGYTLRNAGIYDEMSLEEFVEYIKRNKPINIIAIELQNPEGNYNYLERKVNNSINAA